MPLAVTRARSVDARAPAPIESSTTPKQARGEGCDREATGEQAAEPSPAMKVEHGRGGCPDAERQCRRSRHSPGTPSAYPDITSRSQQGRSMAAQGLRSSKLPGEWYL